MSFEEKIHNSLAPACNYINYTNALNNIIENKKKHSVCIYDKTNKFENYKFVQKDTRLGILVERVKVFFTRRKELAEVNEKFLVDNLNNIMNNTASILEKENCQEYLTKAIVEHWQAVANNISELLRKLDTLGNFKGMGNLRAENARMLKSLEDACKKLDNQQDQQEYQKDQQEYQKQEMKLSRLKEKLLELSEEYKLKNLASTLQHKELLKKIENIFPKVFDILRKTNHPHIKKICIDFLRYCLGLIIIETDKIKKTIEEIELYISESNEAIKENESAIYYTDREISKNKKILKENKLKLVNQKIFLNKFNKEICEVLSKNVHKKLTGKNIFETFKKMKNNQHLCQNFKVNFSKSGEGNLYKKTEEFLNTLNQLAQKNEKLTQKITSLRNRSESLKKSLTNLKKEKCTMEEDKAILQDELNNMTEREILRSCIDHYLSRLHALSPQIEREI